MSETPIVHFEAASTLAVVVSSNEPLLFLSDDLKVIAASASFCRAFGINPVTVPGTLLSELGDGEWAMPTLASLLKATASGSAHRSLRNRAQSARSGSPILGGQRPNAG